MATLKFIIFADMIDFANFGYLGLFLSSFLAATILPLSSEAVLSLLIYNGFSVEWCLIWATLGNWLGGMSGYWLGRLGKLKTIEKWFKIDEQKIEQQRIRVSKFGSVLAFLCWLPAIGDILAIAIGFFGCKHTPTAIWMFVGKATRYAIWAIATFYFMK